jgi:hypothetical protein
MDRAKMSEQTDKTGGVNTSRPSVLLGVAHLTALWALAFLQPMLSLLGKSPEFFVARSNSPGQIILYAVVLAFGPPLVALVVEVIANRISPKLRWGIHLFLMGVVGAALVLTLAKRYLDWSAAVLIGFSALIAIAGVWAYDRWRFPKTFMDILSPAPLVILAVFLFLSPASRVIIPDQNPEAEQIEIGNPARVVMVIFDEFPLASLMKDENSIDASRYPNFAALARQSTWFKNASAAGAYTPVAVPTILTGRRADLDDLPIASDHPESIFTLLGGSYELQVNERITKVCPDSLCPAEEDLGYDSETGALFSDLFVVSQHLLLPNSMRKDLPDISRAFGGFGDDEYGNDDLATGDGQEGQKFERTGRGGVRQLGRIFAGARKEEVQESVTRFNQSLGTRKQEKLDVIHMLEPHVPWNHVPSGQRYTLTEHWSRLVPDDRQWQAPQRVVDIALQRGLLEVGFTDTLFGSIKSSLEEKGLWDDSLVVVTADHGAAFESRVDRRKATNQNIGSIASVPLFIKSPGQKVPEMVERHTCASDILPEVAKRLEIEYPWEAEDCPADTVEVLNPPTGSVKAPVSTMVDQRNRFVEQIDRLFTTGTGWGPVYRSGPRRELIGRPVSDFRRLPEREDQSASPERRNAAKRFDPDAAVLSALLQRGPVRGVGAKQVVAIAVDDRIQGVGWTFRDRILGSAGYSILLPPAAMKPGFNKVDVYLVEQNGNALRQLYSGAGPLED